jgi:hypothetical protein
LSGSPVPFFCGNQSLLPLTVFLFRLLLQLASEKKVIAAVSFTQLLLETSRWWKIM